MALVLLAASPALAGKKRPPALPPSGPAADYPMVIGDPFTIDGKTWTPADTMNYDQVGYAAIGGEGAGVSAAHRTLPLPSYVEVTSLDSGRTILVRLTARGPMRNDRLLELSPAAAAQLGISGEGAPIRMRRVNPPEPERALLRSGQPAPVRMDTPKSLLSVLMRKLTGAPVAVVTASPPEVPAASPTPAAKPRTAAKPAPKPAPVPAPATPPAVRVHRDTVPPIASPAPTPAADTASPARPGGSIVQVAVFSTRERADAAARALGATIIPAGRLFRMQLGPFATPAEAASGLARAKAAGYADARIVRPR